MNKQATSEVPYPQDPDQTVHASDYQGVWGILCIIHICVRQGALVSAPASYDLV